ncbi:hypothetical protein E1265_07720 [Streptomyces sp. 8K308]|uniref:hypothetical protein n=1 Tax=Streptomyces sp. 8K308 TaxID=2530388 RepID=UPI00104AAEA9|nr:hypothetical protein [Streptomyces sp. 8K308]TDC25153.1 hypothetical protein E1265_07720 [Streptomyces sp. 8K308]
MPTWIVPPSTAPRRTATLAAGLLLAALAPGAATAAEDDAGGAPSAFTVEDPRITESSGIQASRRHPGVYWTHNDQDPAGPNLYAVDSATGQTVATVTLSGVEGRDLEAISIGPDGDLYVGDIGDNLDGGWPEVWIYRLPEPAELADATVTPTVYPVTYADGPRDAEALMVHPETGRVYVVSKKQDGTGALYAAPGELSTEGVNTLERVADIGLWTTDGAFSPDGTRLVLRGYFAARVYRWEDDGPVPIERSVFPPVQQQGESVTFAPDGRTLMFGTEGAGSEVEPVELSGDLLPVAAGAEEDGVDEGRDGTGGENAASSDGGDGADADDSGLLTRGAVLVGLGVVAVLGLRRLLRGGGGRRRGA